MRTFHRGSAIRAAEGMRFSQFTPVGDNFGSACDQIDRADVMLAGLHQRVKQGLATLSRPGRRPKDPRSLPWLARTRDLDGQPHT